LDRPGHALEVGRIPDAPGKPDAQDIGRLGHGDALPQFRQGKAPTPVRGVGLVKHHQSIGIVGKEPPDFPRNLRHIPFQGLGFDQPHFMPVGRADEVQILVMNGPFRGPEGRTDISQVEDVPVPIPPAFRYQQDRLVGLFYLLIYAGRLPAILSGDIKNPPQAGEMQAGRADAEHDKEQDQGSPPHAPARIG